MTPRYSEAFKLVSIAGLVLLVSLSISQLSVPSDLENLTETSTSETSFLIQGEDLGQVADAVLKSGAKLTHELSIIRSVGARLTAAQLELLRQDPAVSRIYEDARVEVTRRHSKNKNAPANYTEFPKLVQADRLHKTNKLGRGVTLAVIDTGFFAHPALLYNSKQQTRILAQYDAIQDVEVSPFETTDESGHGSHVTGISINSSKHGKKKFNGMAADADLVAVKAFNADGQATYADVIRGLDWVLNHQHVYNIRVLNLSFSATPRSFYWDDPLNQAVMEAWRAGIVVVVAAGNGGPDPMTVGVPGNVPYVITVGAMTDAYTPNQGADDRLASFSATGPTVEGFIKPEIVAPGGHIESLMPLDSRLATNFPQFHDGGDYFVMSGTSQATAVVSGAALMLISKKPNLKPDQVKCRLMASACTAVDSEGQIAYSPFQQGAGILNAYDATKSRERNCVNQGLDIDLDLAGIEHYAGPVRLSEDGSTFYIEGGSYEWSGASDPKESLWVGGNPWIDASLWSSGNPWIDASLWSTGNPWIDASGNPWIDASGNPWIDASWWIPPTSGVSPEDGNFRVDQPLNINPWVDQE